MKGRAAAVAAATLAGCAPALPAPPLPVAPGERQILATVVQEGLRDRDLCRRLTPALEALHGAKIVECEAHPVRVAPVHGWPFIAYDLVVAISPAAARERDYPTNLVDHVENDLIGGGRAKASLVLQFLPDRGRRVPIIKLLQRSRR
ncbi:MAG: hypothetical protein JO013_11065 [Alphaproteobacteria bacterium]|nr:hypothetical protein [Alphaproteobacteria bacterium]